MPVKNKNRQSNSGYEGVITGLNDEEKKVLEDAGIGGGILRKDATFVDKEGTATIVNTISLTSEEYNKIKNGEINTIYGNFQDETGFISYYNVEIDSIMDDAYVYKNFDMEVGNDEPIGSYFMLFITEEGCELRGMKITQAFLPFLPNDASTKTYTLQAVNGVLTWTGVIGDINAILDNINGEVI